MPAEPWLRELLLAVASDLFILWVVNALLNDAFRSLYRLYRRHFP